MRRPSAPGADSVAARPTRGCPTGALPREGRTPTARGGVRASVLRRPYWKCMRDRRAALAESRLRSGHLRGAHVAEAAEVVGHERRRLPFRVAVPRSRGAGRLVAVGFGVGHAALLDEFHQERLAVDALRLV